VLATGVMTSKCGAGRYARETFDPRWHRIVDESLSLRTGGAEGRRGYRDPVARRRDSSPSWTPPSTLRWSSDDRTAPVRAAAGRAPLGGHGAGLAAKFATTAAAFDESAEVPRENLEALHASGLDKALLPSEFGGQDLSYRSYGEIVRLLSEACPSTACIWVMHIGAAIGLVNMSTPEVARFYADELTAGRRFANALSEPSGGNLFLLPLQHAHAAAGGFRLTGAKRFTSGCEIADHFLVNALIDDQPTFFGVAVDDTIRFLPIGDTMGMRANGSRLVEFAGTLLRDDRRCPATDSAPAQPHRRRARLPVPRCCRRRRQGDRRACPQPRHPHHRRAARHHAVAAIRPGDRAQPP